jgi:hypothetical protein
MSMERCELALQRSRGLRIGNRAARAAIAPAAIATPWLP